MTRNMMRGGLVVFAAVVLAGCGSSDSAKSVVSMATPTATATRTPTRTATPTPTPGPEGPEMHFGSAAPGSGALTLQSDDTRDVEVFFSTCIGGTSPDCADGDAIYIGTDPGFPTIEEDIPGQPLYTLTPNTAVDLVVKAIDPGVTLMFGGVTLNQVNQSVLLGTAPLHADGSWQVVIPPGGTLANRMVTLQLTTPSGDYTASAPFTMTLIPSNSE
jgi:hypothetical protein